MNTRKSSSMSNWPDLRSLYYFTVLTAFIMLIASLSGIFWGSSIYKSDELLQSLQPNDYINLILGIPGMIFSIVSARKGHLWGLLCWPGSLLFVLYNYVAYCFASPDNPLILLHLSLVLLSVYQTVALYSKIDILLLTGASKKNIPFKTTAVILSSLSGLFIIRAIIVIFSSVIGQNSSSQMDMAVNFADFLITPLWFIGGIALMRKKIFGYISVLGFLFQGSMLFLGLLVFFVLQPILYKSPFNPVDFFVIASMGLLFFIPFFIFLQKIKEWEQESH